LRGKAREFELRFLLVSRWRTRQLAKGADEAVTSLGYRFDELGILSQGFARDEDVVGKIALLDKGVGPKCPDKFVFLQQMAAVADQEH
jgi:hypothetical protein